MVTLFRGYFTVITMCACLFHVVLDLARLLLFNLPSIGSYSELLQVPKKWPLWSCRSRTNIYSHQKHQSSGWLNTVLKLESTGYSTLPLPSRLMRRTHTQRDGRRGTQYLLRSLNDGKGNNFIIKAVLGPEKGQWKRDAFECHVLVANHLSSVLYVMYAYVWDISVIYCQFYRVVQKESHQIS